MFDPNDTNIPCMNENISSKIIKFLLLKASYTVAQNPFSLFRSLAVDAATEGAFSGLSFKIKVYGIVLNVIHPF